ncbi:MAG: hydrogenase 3 maturation endopeptidase HyCI [Methanomicrobiales archaeon]|nr:hydrogenase 3 maturation endopeptidase HyCI [Methanomicrobiales archaeon]
MNMLLGIGNTLRRDDSVGIYVAHHLNLDGWTAIDCGTTPENFTSVVHRAHPDLVLIVDAADIGLQPGEFRIIPAERIGEAGIGTHQLALNHLITYLRCAAGSILLIGIQPYDVGDGEGLSPAVIEGAERLLNLIREGRLDTIPHW